MKVDVKVDININAQGIKDAVSSTQLWRFAAVEWHRLYRPYVPFQTGVLYNEVVITPDKYGATIEHTMPYAHYIYNGVSKSGSPLHFRRTMSFMASREWDKAAIPTKLPILIQAIENYIGKSL
jgi:hypothetical protein